MAIPFPTTPSLIIGKSGTTPEVISELKSQLQKKKLVKIRILRTTGIGTGIDRKGYFYSLAEEVGAEDVIRKVLNRVEVP